MKYEETVKKIAEDLLHDRSLLELWCDKHNHFMSLLRTVLGFMNFILAGFVFAKVFEII